MTFLRKIYVFGPERYASGEFRMFHTEELHSLYRSPNIARVVKPILLRWTGHLARLEEGRIALNIFPGEPT